MDFYSNEELDEFLDEIEENETIVNRRNLAYRRNERKKAIRRKKILATNLLGGNPKKFDGMLSKGHIMCNCPLCKPSKFLYKKSEKTKEERKRATTEIKEYLSNPDSFVA